MPNKLKYQEGDKIGLITILSRAPTPEGKRGVYWDCECECGNKHFICSTRKLSSAKSNNKMPCNCGCLNKKQASELGKSKAKDLTNQQFGYLIALEPTEGRSAEAIVWKCQCTKCGSIVKVRSTSLRNNHTQSCGCLKSAGELKIAQILKENDIDFQREYVFNNFSYGNSKGHPRFDFYVKNQYIIEYDGKAHFETNGGWNNEENLQKIKEHDKIKNEWCLKNNIPLIRIPFSAFNEITIQDLLPATSKYIYAEEEDN